MSFKCNICQKGQPEGTAPIRIVVAHRVKHYANGGSGVEIVKELSFCTECAEEYESQKEVLADKTAERALLQKSFGPEGTWGVDSKVAAISS